MQLHINHHQVLLIMVANGFIASNGNPNDIKSVHCIQDPKNGNIVSIYDGFLI